MTAGSARLLVFCTMTLIISSLRCGRLDDIEETFSKKPEVTAISKVLKIIIPLSYAAAMAMDAVKGDTAPQVSVVTGLTQFPGNAIFSINVSNNYKLPIGSDNSGTVFVAGYWTDVNQAVLSVFFTDLSIKEGAFTLKNVATFPVERDSNGVRVVYTDQDVNSDTDTSMTISLTNEEMQFEWAKLLSQEPVDSNISIDQNAWIITVDTKGTAGDQSDDIYTLAGAGQHAGAGTNNASVIQLVMIEVAFTPLKRLNPYAGRGILRDIDIGTGSMPELGTSVLKFHSKNDGRIDVVIATGVYIGSTGKTLPLHLDD